MPDTPADTAQATFDSVVGDIDDFFRSLA